MAPVDSNILVLREISGICHINNTDMDVDQELALNTNATGSGFLSHATEINTTTTSSSSSSSSFSASTLPPEYPVCETLSNYKNNWPLDHTKTQTTFPCFKTYNVYSEKPIEPCAQKVLGLTIFNSPVEMYQFSVDMTMSNPGILDKLEASIDTARVRDVGGDILAEIFRHDIVVPMPEMRIKVLDEYYVIDSHSESKDPRRWYYEAKGKGKHIKRTSPSSVFHIKNHTKTHKQHKKLAQELVDFQSDLVPFERWRFKEIVYNHSKGLLDFITNKVLVAGVFNSPMPSANAKRYNIFIPHQFIIMHIVQWPTL
ncbi:MAG: hypothetical protein BYD32DRAFT_479379 [Podila humilis]|nr:MAG: hypothetical protein BYD32DRAFT_479379 [Podila humilis]